MLGGGMAEVAALLPDTVFKLPDNVSFEAAPPAVQRPHDALRPSQAGAAERGRNGPGPRCGGGIGTSTLRLAPALGAGRTIAVVSTEEKVAVAEAAGASDVVLTDGWLEFGARADRRPRRRHRRRPGRR